MTIFYKMKGIPNMGNTCYFASAVQCMLQVPLVANYFILGQYTGGCDFTLEFQNVAKEIWTSKDVNINIYIFKNIYNIFINKFTQFKNSNQHDVQEAFICIVDILDSSTKIIKSNFYSKLKKEIIFPTGKSESFEDMIVHFLYPDKSHETIRDTIAHNEKWSTISGYEDDTGKTHHVATTRTAIVTAPKVLVFSLGYRHKIKLTEHIDVAGKRYSYISSAVHMGNDHHGHYVSVGRHRGKWYLKDDLSISEIEQPLDNFHYLVIYYMNSPT
jgi:ubiquitin C-terminal hydrolase